MLEALDAIVLPFLESLYERFGYVGVVIAMTIESCAIPLPSELILPFAGWSVSRGLVEPLTSSPWSYWGAVFAGVLGNTLGSLASYAIGAYGGRPLVERYGKYVLISAHDLKPRSAGSRGSARRRSSSRACCRSFAPSSPCLPA